MIDSNIFKKPMAAELTNKRIQARKKRRLTYDCMGAIVKGAVVVCKEGHHFMSLGRGKGGGKGEGLPLLAVLRGRSSGACQRCRDFNQETTE
jgi:hypothetical protein